MNLLSLVIWLRLIWLSLSLKITQNTALVEQNHHVRPSLSSAFRNLYSQNMRGFDHETILSPSFHRVRNERLAQWPPICDPNTTKSLGGTSRKIGWGSAVRFLKPLPYFRPKSVIFPTLFQTWSKIWYFQTWSPGAQGVTRARDKLLRHVHGSWRKH